jgi:hypothetical protein
VVNKSPHHGKPVEICFLQQQQLKIVDRKDYAWAILQCRGMDSYLPQVINESESKILKSCGKIQFWYNFLIHSHLPGCQSCTLSLWIQHKFCGGTLWAIWLILSWALQDILGIHPCDNEYCTVHLLSYYGKASLPGNTKVESNSSIACLSI